jgi:hypothetical protein
MIRAEIVLELEDEDYGSRGYTAKDRRERLDVRDLPARAVTAARAAHASGLARRA